MFIYILHKKINDSILNYIIILKDLKVNPMLLIFQARTFTYIMPLNYNCKTCQQDVHQKTNNLFNLRLCSNGHNRVSIQHCHLHQKKKKPYITMYSIVANICLYLNFTMTTIMVHISEWSFNIFCWL